MNTNVEQYLAQLSKEKTSHLTRERLLTDTILCINKINIEIQELENNILKNSHASAFSILILGSHLETIKREIINLKQDFQKKW